MPAPGENAGSVCVYVVSSLLFLAILVGGIFLLLYIALPETPSTAWFPVAGMTLVATPWLFWLVTFFYRAIKLRRYGSQLGGGEDRALEPVMAVSMGEDAAVESPAAGCRRVRFGAVTVMGGSSRHRLMADGGDSSVGGSSEKTEVEPEEESEGNCHGTPTSSMSDGTCSSLTSSATEQPLYAAKTT